MRSRPIALALISGLFLSAPVHAEDDPVFTIEFRDGAIAPARLLVPAERRFKLVLRNLGTSAIEFESVTLRKEKVLAPGSESFLVIRRLDVGDYDFFDDFHLDQPPATLMAR